MTKEQIAALIKISAGVLRPMSAQVYNALSREEKELLREVVTDEGLSYADYEQTMMALFPKGVTLPASSWRR